MKKVRKLESNTLAFLLIVVFMFVGVGGKYLVNVLANSGSNIGGDASDVGSEIACKTVSCRNASVKGIRVTLTDESGNRINGIESKNFITSGSNMSSSFYYDSNSSRVESGGSFSTGAFPYQGMIETIFDYRTYYFR